MYSRNVGQTDDVRMWANIALGMEVERRYHIEELTEKYIGKDPWTDRRWFNRASVMNAYDTWARRSLRKTGVKFQVKLDPEARCQRDRQGTDDVLDEIERDLAAISQKSKAPNAMDSVLIATAINDIPTDSNETIASNTAAFSSHCVAADHSTIAEFYHDDEADSATSTQFSDNTVIKNCTTGGPIYDSNGFFVDWR
ncbi:hypothetical protein ACMFMG_003442 [Clarireedia jacksonii]